MAALSLSVPGKLWKNAATEPNQNTDPARIANTTREGGQFIKAIVAPDGSSFSVRIGEDGKPVTFQTR